MLTSVLVQNAFGFEQLTVSTTSTVCSSTIYNPTVSSSVGAQTRAEAALIVAEDNSQSYSSNAIRFRTDGVAPTASVGTPLLPNVAVLIVGYPDIVNFKAIRIGSNDVKLNIHYLRNANWIP